MSAAPAVVRVMIGCKFRLLRDRTALEELRRTPSKALIG